MNTLITHKKTYITVTSSNIVKYIYEYVDLKL